MPCTTILVGKNATNDGSTIVARTDDGFFDEKKVIVVEPIDQPKTYVSKIGHLTIDLPSDPVRYTSCPSIDQSNGVWAATGINAYNVGMTATETITSNPRVLGADPLVKYQKAKNENEADIPGGIGEEDMVVLVLPYIKTAREGVMRLGALLEKYGTYESNGIAFNDENEVWWLETIGGHHWIAARLEDEEYVIMPNQFGLDIFDFDDANGRQEFFMCSKGLKEFTEKNHLYLGYDTTSFNPRLAYGSNTDADHVYNTPRAWFMARYFNPNTYDWDSDNAKFNPESANIPWSFVAEKKITIEDVKYILSSYYQGTPYNPYSTNATKKGIYRPIGIARTGVTGILQIRPDKLDAIKAVEWITFGANPFNAALPIYTNVSKLPDYLSKVTLDCDTNTFYWGSRLIGALADPNYGTCIQLIERYQQAMANNARAILNKYDALYEQTKNIQLLEEANEELAKMAKQETISTLNKVLKDASIHMKCNYSRADN